MRYLKLLLSSILLLFVAAIIIWIGVFAVVFSLLAAPILAWWIKRKTDKTFSENISESTMESANVVDYKVIEAEYEIIEK